jgi:hypothetical protein
MTAMFELIKNSYKKEAVTNYRVNELTKNKDSSMPDNLLLYFATTS